MQPLGGEAGSEEVAVVHQGVSTPASARSAASSGSQTRSVSHSPRASTPKRRCTASCIQLDLLHAIRPRQRGEHRLIEAGEENLDLALRCERSQPVEVGGLVRLEPLEQRPREMKHDRQEATAGEPIEQGAIHVFDVLGEHMVEVADRLVDVESEYESDRRLSAERQRSGAAAGHGHGGKDIGEKVVAAVQLLGRRLRLGEARFGAGQGAASRASASSQCCREPPLGVVRCGTGRDDELPVGRLGQQQLARGLGQHRARGGLARSRPAPRQKLSSSGQSAPRSSRPSVSHMLKSPLAPQEPGGSATAARGRCSARCARRGERAGRRAARVRAAGTAPPRKSTPSNHQWPKSSVSNGATMTARAGAALVAMPPSSRSEVLGMPAGPRARAASGS